MADAFFADPHTSIRGWERAIDTQTRIVTGLADLLAPDGDTGIAVIGQRGVGTLWYCHLTGQPIHLRHDQPGQGHYFAVDLSAGAVVHPWRPIDRIDP